MAINLDQVRKDESEELGNLTEETAFSGDITGTYNNTITFAIYGRQIANNTPQVEYSFVWEESPAPRWTPKRVVLFDKNLPAISASSWLSGSFETGITLDRVGNVTLPTPAFTPATSGLALVTNAANELVPTAVTPVTNTVVTSATHTAVNGEIIFVDSTANAVTINPPTSPAPVNGDNFTVHVVLGANDVTVNAATPIVRAPVFGLLCVFISNSWQTLSIASPAIPSP